MIHVIIDTREQQPWAFPPDHATVRRAGLKAGDYALVGDDGYAIERKSREDFAGTISIGWARFLRELDRMKDAGFETRPIVVESDLEAFLFRQAADGEIIPPSHEHFRVTPQFLLHRLAELDHMPGVKITFAGSAEYAAAYALHLLKERARRIEGKS